LFVHLLAEFSPLGSKLLKFEEGVLNSKDTFEFEERCATITTLPGASSQEFFNYFQNILQPKLKLNFSNLEPSGLNSASKWTNNNAESIHNLMKIDVTFKCLVQSDLLASGKTVSIALMRDFFSSLPIWIEGGRITSTLSI
jgi:hypothetical protein